MKDIKKAFARTLRSNQTRSEKVIWEILGDRKFMGYKFRRQHVVEGFVLDFYCQELRLGIEIDGCIHLKRKDYDKIRQEIIESEGIKVLRIKNNDITSNKRSVMGKMYKIIGQRPNPSPFGRGRLENQGTIYDNAGEGVRGCNK